MKRPICRENIPQFREHALQHIRADDAYAVETFDPAKGVIALTLHPTVEPLDKARVRQLRQQFETATSTVIYRIKLAMIERRMTVAK